MDLLEELAGLFMAGRALIPPRKEKEKNEWQCD